MFTNLIKVDTTLTKDKLYSAGAEWFATTYHNARFVLQMQDKDAGVIIGKGSFEYTVSGTNRQAVSYTVKLSFKNGRMKYEIFDFLSSYYNLMRDGEVTKAPWVSRSTIKKGYAKTQTACTENGKSLSGSIEAYFIALKPQSNW